MKINFAKKAKWNKSINFKDQDQTYRNIAKFNKVSLVYHLIENNRHKINKIKI